MAATTPPKKPSTAARATLKAEALATAVYPGDAAEAADIPQIEIEYQGDRYSIRADALLDVEVLEAVEDEKWITVMRAILGTTQWTQFKNSARQPDGRVPASKLEEFLQVVMTAADPRIAS